MTDRITAPAERRESAENSRNYGIDALRIVSMIMIVFLHVLGHGGVLDNAESHLFRVAWLFEIASYCAVNCYALISGYVGVYSKYKFSNLLLLWCRVAFYSVGITLICKCIFPAEIGRKALFSSFVPIFSGEYWYFTAYAIMFLFIPVLNEALNRLSERKLRVTLISLFIVFSVVYPFSSKLFGDVAHLHDGYSALWLMIMYLLGGYIRKYGLFNKIKSRRTLIFSSAYIVFVLATFASKFFIRFISVRIWGEIKFENTLVSYMSLTVIGAAVSLVLAFEKIKLRPAVIKAVSFLSPLAFSVYLIHEHPQIRARLIKGSFVWIANLPVYKMIPALLGVVIAVYLTCTLIDLIRHYLFKVLKLKERLYSLENRFKNRKNRVKS